MDPQFKFRHVNEITGVFVLLAVALFVAAIFLAGRAQGLFRPKLTLKTEFTTLEGAFGLQEGAEIRILDTRAGVVKHLVPNDDGVIEASYILDSSFAPFLRATSTAIVKRKFALAGDAFVEITVGDPESPRLEDGAAIRTVKDTEITALLMEVVEEIKKSALPALEKIQLVLDELPALTVQTRKTLYQAECLMRDELPPVTRQAGGTLEQTQTLLRAELPAITLQARDTMAQAQSTLLEVQLLMEGMQQNWLFRGSVQQVPARPALAPADVGPVWGGVQP